MTNKPKRKSGLGRGMEALFDVYAETPTDNETVVEINLDEIRPNPYQPRKHFDEEALNELAESIKQSGVFQPIILRKSTIKGYELIAGERRMRASKIAGKTTIPAIVRQLDDERMIEIAVLENLQREDLSPLEEAEAYNVLMDKLELTQAEVAERMGKSRPYIANYLRLLSLPEAVKEMVNKEELSMGQARTLLGLKNKQDIIKLAHKVVQDKLTVRQLEEFVQSMNDKIQAKPQPKPSKSRQKSQYVLKIEQHLEDYFGTHTTLTQKGDRGKIEIEYMSQSDLTRILDILNIQL